MADVIRRTALVVAVLLAGCTTAPRPAPVVPTSSGNTRDDTSLVAELLARPLHLPNLAAGAGCPRGTPIAHSPVSQPGVASGFGAAPLYPTALYLGEDATLHLSREPMPTMTAVPDGLVGLKVVWANVPYSGPAVVRVGRLDGPGRGYVRLSYHPDASRGDAVVFRLSGAADWPSFTYVTGPGCYAYQIDGASFSELVAFRVVA